MPEAGGRAPLAGTVTLLRFMLRRDRIKLPAWVLGIALFWLYYTRLVPSAYGTPAELQSASQLMEGPMGRVFTGPSYGIDDLAYDRFITGAYGLYVLLLVALMSILLVVRHTRVEEQTGRAELVRANVVGRHAPLTAALGVAVITNAAAAIAVGLVTVTSPEFGVGGSVLFAAGIGAAGLAFAGLAAVTAQLSAFSRAAAGLAGGGLGAAFALRALGDMAREQGSVLSWLSPLAWSQQTAPFVLDRWWPLALSVVFAVATATAALVVAGRRDLGASLFTVRPGRDHAPAWLRSPFTLAVRLLRASIIGWTVSLAAAGFVFGAWADAMLTSADDLPDTLLEVAGGDGDVVAGYLSLMALFMALLVGIFGILAVQGLRAEETSGRGEPVLATAISRRAWLGSHLAATAGGVVVALAATGVATGVGAAVVTGDAGRVADLVAGHLVYVPPVLLVVGIAALLFGVAPRAIPLSWTLLAYGMLVGVFGPLMDLPSWAERLSPFDHVARVPLESFTALPLLVLAVLTLAAAGAGVLGFRRRDVDLA